MTLFTDADKAAAASSPVLADYAQALGMQAINPRGLGARLTVEDVIEQRTGVTASNVPLDPPPDRLTVLRLDDGGYLVYREAGGQQVASFGSTTIDEALDYVSDRLGPPD